MRSKGKALRDLPGWSDAITRVSGQIGTTHAHELDLLGSFIAPPGFTRVTPAFVYAVVVGLVRQSSQESCAAILERNNLPAGEREWAWPKVHGRNDIGVWEGYWHHMFESGGPPKDIDAHMARKDGAP